MLYGERKRLAAIAEREAAGENLWVEKLPYEARRKIAYAWEQLAEGDAYHGSRVAGTVRHLFIRHTGVDRGSTPSDFMNAAQIHDTDLDMSYIEAAYRALHKHNCRPQLFEVEVNRIFNSHRVAYRVVEGDVVPFTSDELHRSVVEPAVRLLIGRRDFDRAQAAYLDALKEISRREPGNAITDAGTALQEALKALGCEGNALGPLIRDARKRGILAPHDSALVEGIVKFLHWASANRSETGDAHEYSDATLNDAWLMVHIVGALLLRLADGVPRAGE